MNTKFKKNHITVTVGFGEEGLSIIDYCVRLKQFEDTRDELTKHGWSEVVMLAEEQAGGLE